MTKIKEKRILHIAEQDRSTRAAKDEAGNMIIEGYAAVFNQRSRLIFEFGEVFHEIIEPGAFDEVLRSESIDVLYTYDHDDKQPMARFKPARGINTLALSVDDYGLKYRAVLNNTQLSRDTFARVQSGEVFENSFVFIIDATGERWARGEDGTPLRHVAKVRGLYDVSAVVNGAYGNTDMAAAARSFQEFQESETANDAPAVPDVPPVVPPGPDYFQSMYEEFLDITG